MAITALKYLTANSAAALNILVAAEIAASRYPVGDIAVRSVQEYPPKFELVLATGTGATALTAWQLAEADSIGDLQTQATAQIAATNLPLGSPQSCAFQNPARRTRYWQAFGK